MSLTVQPVYNKHPKSFVITSILWSFHFFVHCLLLQQYFRCSVHNSVTPPVLLHDLWSLVNSPDSVVILSYYTGSSHPFGPRPLRPQSSNLLQSDKTGTPSLYPGPPSGPKVNPTLPPSSHTLFLPPPFLSHKWSIDHDMSGPRVSVDVFGSLSIVVLRQDLMTGRSFTLTLRSNTGVYRDGPGR